MKKKKKELTSEQLYSSFKHKRWGCFIGKWISIVSPFIAIGAVNFNEYFTEYNGIHMSFGCTLALVVMGFAMWSNIKANDDNPNTKRIKNIVKWGIAWGLIYFFSSILQDLVLIVGCGFAGQVVGCGFDVASEIYKTKEEIVYEANVNAKAKIDAANAK